MLPAFDGLEVRRDPGCPRPFLTARDAVEDRVAGLTAGGGDPIELTATEFELLRYLMRNPKRVLSKKVDVGRTPMIHTVRGARYLLKPGA